MARMVGDLCTWLRAAASQSFPLAGELKTDEEWTERRIVDYGWIDLDINVSPLYVVAFCGRWRILPNRMLFILHTSLTTLTWAIVYMRIIENIVIARRRRNDRDRSQMMHLKHREMTFLYYIISTSSTNSVRIWKALMSWLPSFFCLSLAVASLSTTSNVL